LLDCAPTDAAAGSTAGSTGPATEAAAFATAAIGFAFTPDADALALSPIIGTANAAIATTRTASNNPLLIVPLFIVISVSPLQISENSRLGFAGYFATFTSEPLSGAESNKNSNAKKEAV